MNCSYSYSFVFYGKPRGQRKTGVERGPSHLVTRFGREPAEGYSKAPFRIDMPSFAARRPMA